MTEKPFISFIGLQDRIFGSPDLQEEWKRQEQIEDMRKKAEAMQKKYQGGFGVVSESAKAPLFNADFNGEDPNIRGSTDQAVGQEFQESGADLHLGEDEDVSDLSSLGSVRG